MVKKNLSIMLSYLYTLLIQFRVTRIINVLFITTILGMRLTEFALLESIYAASQFLMEVPSGIMADKIGKKITVCAGLLASAISQVGICLCFWIQGNKLWLLLAAFVLDGIAHALLSGADDALIFENIRNDHMEDSYDKIRGECQLVGAITLGIATAIGGFLFEINPVVPYFCQATAAGLGIIPILMCHEEKSNLVHGGKEKKSSIDVLIGVKNNRFLIYMVIFTCISMSAINTIFGIMPAYTDSIGFSSSQNGILFMAISFIGGIVASQAYRLNNKTNMQLAVLVVFMLNIGAILTNVVSLKMIVFIGLSLLYVVIDVIDPIAMKVFQMEIADEIRSTFLSMVSFLISAVSMVLYPVLAYLVEMVGMSHTLIYMAVILSIVLIAISLIERKKASENAISELSR